MSIIIWCVHLTYNFPSYKTPLFIEVFYMIYFLGATFFGFFVSFLWVIPFAIDYKLIIDNIFIITLF